MPTEYEIQKLLFNQYPKPKNCDKIKVINTHSNHWRINLYLSYEQEGLKKHKIESYSCRYLDEELSCCTPKLFA